MKCISFALASRYLDLTIVLWTTVWDLVACDCSRGTSRLVRNFFYQKADVIFSSYGLSVPSRCPLSIKRDQFGYQDLYRRQDTMNKWTCEFCGKGFYAAHHLDVHFERRHSDKLLQGDHVTCLADYCDWMRCDVLGGRVHAQFWHHALCRQSYMKSLADKCRDVLSACVPDDANSTLQALIFSQLNSSICGYLSCERYWEDEEQKVSWVILYIIFGVFVSFGLLIYYYIAYTHFYTDESLLIDSRQYCNHRQQYISQRLHETPPVIRHRTTRPTFD